MEKTKKQYQAPHVEAMDCKVEKGFLISGGEITPQLEGLTEGGNANTLFN